MNHPQFAPACQITLGAFAVLILMTVLMLVLPTSAFAQTVTPADLVGSWAWQGEKQVRLTFRADSTMAMAMSTNLGSGIATCRWRLASDTLVINKCMVEIPGQGDIPLATSRRVLTFEEKLLSMTKVGGVAQGGPKTRLYDRVDSLNVDPPKRP